MKLVQNQYHVSTESVINQTEIWNQIIEYYRIRRKSVSNEYQIHNSIKYQYGSVLNQGGIRMESVLNKYQISIRYQAIHGALRTIAY